MQAPFVVHALSYCLGRGQLALKGREMRPWLTLQRLETERDYLGHQLRRLRQLSPEPLEVHWDRLPGDSYYDYERVRLHSEALHQAYALLYPRDCWTLSLEVLRLCSWRGLAALFIDSGRALRGRPRYGSQGSHLRDTDFLLLGAYLEELGYGCDYETLTGSITGLFVPLRVSDRFWAQLRPHVPRGMRPRLRGERD